MKENKWPPTAPSPPTVARRDTVMVLIMRVHFGAFETRSRWTCLNLHVPSRHRRRHALWLPSASSCPSTLTSDSCLGASLLLSYCRLSLSAPTTYTTIPRFLDSAPYRVSDNSHNQRLQRLLTTTLLSARARFLHLHANLSPGANWTNLAQLDSSQHPTPSYDHPLSPLIPLAAHLTAISLGQSSICN